MSTEKKSMNEWLKLIIEAVIEGIILGLVLFVMKKMGVLNG